MDTRWHIVTVVLGIVLGCNSAMAAPPDRQAGAIVQPAPVGHLQPRPQQFSPGSPADQTEQDKMSTFDAEQQKLDQELDRKLSICRC